MTRIIAVADTHMQHERLRVPHGDIFLHAGDLTDIGTEHELRTIAEWIRRLPHAHKIVIAGNHDIGLERYPHYRKIFEGVATYLQDEEVTVEGLRFYGAPWTPRFYDWAFMRDRGPAIAERWAQIPQGLDVLVTHGPPRGHGDRASRLRGFEDAHMGCADLAARVLEVAPRLHLFGHIHEDPGSWSPDGQATTYCNVTTSACRRGATVLDLAPAQS